ncbi:hypothetical protein PIB30_065952 [Stylosanthes scabra]|uniref:Protein IQ-DOMAIN 1 n=1 Tax=Stylosanthes scabra TaxID=79078 RepID=A0ABU6RMX4_9FABA|nr:hypothetical protein [Stylosanthes scabra]
MHSPAKEKKVQSYILSHRDNFKSLFSLANDAVSQSQILEDGEPLVYGLLRKEWFQCFDEEEWDDSTVSSYFSKMRMQNRMEATTRRERALAYAFSQQLRICSKRRPAKCNSIESNMSWSWLERWMATRVPDTAALSAESHALKQHDPPNINFTIKTRFLDAAAGEEKESCGSNEVLPHFDNYSVNSREENCSFKSQEKTNFKDRRTVSRRKTVPSYQFLEEQPKVCKKEGSNNASKDVKQKTKASGKEDETETETKHP